MWQGHLWAWEGYRLWGMAMKATRSQVAHLGCALFYSLPLVRTPVVQIDASLWTKDLANAEPSLQEMFYSSLRKLELIPVIYVAQTHVHLQLHVCVVPKLNSLFNQSCKSYWFPGIDTYTWTNMWWRSILERRISSKTDAKVQNLPF